MAETRIKFNSMLGVEFVQHLSTDTSITHTLCGTPVLQNQNKGIALNTIGVFFVEDFEFFRQGYGKGYEYCLRCIKILESHQ